LKTREYIAFTASAMLMTAVGIDIMLPALGDIRNHFHLGSESTEAAQIISFFFMGQIGQLLFGPLSDRYGRLPVMRLGFLIYILAGAAAAFSESLTVIFILRFLSGMGASAIFTTSIAGVRDRYAGDQMASIMSLVFTLFLFTPILAPFLGAFILHLSAWRMVFFTPSLLAVFILLWSFRLKESLRKTSTDVAAYNLLTSARQILQNTTFIRYTLLTTILFTVFSAYIASSEFIIGVIYRQPALFTWIFAGTGVIMAIFTFMNSKLSVRFGAFRTLKALVISYFLISMVFLVVTLVSGGSPSLSIFLGFAVLLTAINVTIEPNSSALALEQLGDNAGMASAIYGTSFFFIGSGIGTLISNQLKTGVQNMVICYAVIGIIALLIVLLKRKD
jgi:DHA1 family bicyclomycin/chloramphenicol resistance-like MFS transporter